MDKHKGKPWARARRYGPMPKDGRFYLRDRVTAEEKQANAEYGNYESARLYDSPGLLRRRGYVSVADSIVPIDAR